MGHSIKAAFCVGVALVTTPFEGVFAEESPRLETVVVTASRRATSLQQAPASISVVDAEELRRINADDVADALTAEVGLTVTPVGQTRRGISIRGMPVEHTLYLIDGRRINSSNSVIAHSDYELSWLPNSAIERIEVVRGPMSSLYGADALGGVVNVITKAPGEEFFGELSTTATFVDGAEGGDSTKTSLYMAGPLIPDTLAFTLAGQVLDRDNLPTEEDETVSEIEERESGAARGSSMWTPVDGQQLALSYSRNDDTRELDIASRSGNYTSTDDIEREQYGLAYQGNWQWGHAIVNAYQSSVLRENRRSAGGTALLPQEIEDQIVDGHVGAALGPRHFLTVGGQLREETLNDQRLQGSGEASASHHTVFLQDEWQLSNALQIVAGVGVDNHEDYGSEVSPRLYSVYRHSDAWTLKGGYGEGFRAPSLTELSKNYQVLAAGGRFWVEGNPDLEPERSKSYEIGLEYSHADMQLSARLFRNELNNLVQTVCYSDCGVRGVERRNYQNVDESLIRGLELAVSRHLSDSVALVANYSYLNTEDLGSGEALENRPLNAANVTLSWTPVATTQLRWRAEYVGKQYNSGEYTPDYTLHHLDITVDLTESLRLYSGVENLFDERLAEKSELFTLAEAGREFRIGLTLAF
ncbi:TonB-dependent receptor [uncultured Spongiibacter sp.]|uniref:TonB-dependent receptor domain-containing protein n=1 Tax=uncultured Spongiibacter sp. TaxID=870896 RepID=UPI0025949BDA|nr:TonB-dependent receptor [uncultured Spongiibacter sp.]